MADGSVGMSGHNFDAFVSSQRVYNNEPDWAAKIQEKYWRARQKFLAKIERKEDSCIVLSDSKLDSKLEIYHSIDRSCDKLTEILESYQNCLFVFANEENALGILLKECGKHDKTKAGKIMTVAGKSLTQSSHQHIRLYMPLLRLFQEMETFHSRAVEDTANTVDKLEERRAQYRSSLLRMKDISEKLDPDVYKQLDKFRRVQQKVRDDKRAFDGMQMDVVQKIDLLMASRCNLMNQTLAPYQTILLETFEKNLNNFKSVESIISSEDLYEYEFKTLKQLNPLRISDEAPLERSAPTTLAKSKLDDKTKVEEAPDLIGNLEHDEGQNVAFDNNNNPASQSAQEDEPQTGGLIDVTLESEPEPSKNYIRPRLDSLVSLDDEVGGGHQNELARSLDLLDTLFGSSLEASEAESEGPSSSKTKRRVEDVKALRSNLNANLLDVDGEGDEAKQVASLLGFSEAAGQQQNTNNNNNNNSHQFKFFQEDLFSKWAKEAEGAASAAAEAAAATSGDNKTSEHPKEANMTTNNLDQDLMDLGGATMPTKSAGTSLDDFLA